MKIIIKSLVINSNIPEDVMPLVKKMFDEHRLETKAEAAKQPMPSFVIANVDEYGAPLPKGDNFDLNKPIKDMTLKERTMLYNLIGGDLFNERVEKENEGEGKPND